MSGPIHACEDLDFAVVVASHSLPAEAAVLALLGKLLILLMCMSVKLLCTVILENIPSETLTSRFKFSALTRILHFCQARRSRAFWGSLYQLSLWLFIALLAQVTVSLRLDHSVVHCCFQAKKVRFHFGLH